MTSTSHIPLSSSELNNVWMTYQKKTLIVRFLEHFQEHVEDAEAKQILKEYYDISSKVVTDLENIFRQEGAAVPLGFTDNDVIKGTPKLFDFHYDMMFARLMTKISIGLYGLYSTMSYRKDIRDLYKQLTFDGQSIYDKCTGFLLDKGILSRPPYVSMPKGYPFVQDQDYLSGYHLLKETRSLNTTEVSLLHHAIETNLTGMQLMIGFAQSARNEEVKKYFVKGMELSKEVETTLGDFLRKDFIEPPATHAGKVTASKVPPFSDKMMMYITNLLSTFGLGSNALGGAFSLRSDLPITMAQIGQKIYFFAKEGGEIMIKNRWLEEPPKVEDRRKLTR
ncbi:DUF3231 family protein [Evansella cellulosilytica]|uniref:DUF3231 family protein n=1 Tax=Evansella cellulosilytica (strain ATCC 21833 / DSM 2522 / FERM P-1141 / JCM 9156 / N-4) TaxID=649639 RepID=E6TVM1_EVAC2|nr:DUF3231 family protein [Evansella cellulosilytica]ADU32149.1 hypothetical protein Bcell_3913 [Evansella cellulosilytica DSM 2522]